MPANPPSGALRRDLDFNDGPLWSYMAGALKGASASSPEPWARACRAESQAIHLLLHHSVPCLPTPGARKVGTGWCGVGAPPGLRATV